MKYAAFSALLPLALLAACSGSGEPANAVKTSKSDGPEANCATRAAVDQIRDTIFDAAIAQAKEGTQNLNNLRAAVIGRIEAPVLSGHDEAIKKTSCAGKLVFNLPPNTLKAFGGVTALAANIDYAVQPAADKSGMVVTASGTNPIIQSLVAAANMKAITRSALPAAAPDAAATASTAPPPMPYGKNNDEYSGRIGAALPTFSCDGTLNSVERLICKDPLLADQDRAMNAAYRDAKHRTPAALQGQLEGVRRKYFNRRNACGDGVCVGHIYDEWISAMYNWTPDDGREMPF